MEGYLQTDYFAKGSMYPKVNAYVKFLNECTGKTVIISSLEKTQLAFEGKAATIIK